MWVVSKKPFNDAAKKYPNQRQIINDTYKILKKGQFSSPDEMKKVFPSLDNFKYKDKWWVLDIGGNHLRIIAFIQFRCNKIFIKYIFTHSEYDKFCKKCREGR